MDAGNQGHAARGFLFMLAGLEAGMLGALIMFGWLALASAWYRRSIWTTANLLATTFYGESAMRRGFAWTSVSGMALHLIVYAILGALFGLAMQDRFAGVRISLIAILSALGWYYLAFGVVWKNLNPLVALYTHDRPMLMGHILYGGWLGRFPVYLRSMSKSGAVAAPSEAPALGDTSASSV